MRATDLLKRYRQSINPPYSSKDIIPILGILFILLVLPLTVIAVQQSREPSAKGAGQTQLALVIDSGITGPVRWFDQTRTQRCYGEDNEHYRLYEGYLDGGSSLTAESYMCVTGQSIHWQGGYSGSGNGDLRVTLRAPTGIVVDLESPSGKRYGLRDAGTDRKFLLGNKCVLLEQEEGIWRIHAHNITDRRIRDIKMEVEIFGSYPPLQQQKCLEPDWMFFPPRIVFPTEGSVLSGTLTFEVTNPRQKATKSTVEFAMYDIVQLYFREQVRRNPVQQRFTAGVAGERPDSWTLEINTTQLPNGDYRVIADTWDSKRNYHDRHIVSSPITITVRN